MYVYSSLQQNTEFHINLDSENCKRCLNNCQNRIFLGLLCDSLVLSAFRTCPKSLKTT